MAGLGTTGVLIGSFFLLLTVGSTLVAFRGVPGQASNGDLSRIELRQQREAAQRGAAVLAAGNVLSEDDAEGSRNGASGEVLRQGSARSGAAGQIEEGATGNVGSDALRPGHRGTPAEKAPSTGSPVGAPGTGNGVIAVPLAPGTPAAPGTGSGTDTDNGSGTGSGTGSGSAPGSDAGSGSGSTDSGGSSGSGSSGSGGSSDSGGSSGSTGSSGSGGATDVVDTVEETTDSAGAAVGTVSPGAGQAVSGTGNAVGGLLDDVTSVVDDLVGLGG